MLGQRTEDRELLQGFALLMAIAVEGLIAAELRPYPVERLHLEDGIAVNVTLLVERTARGRQELELNPTLGGTRDLLDAQIQHVPKAPAAGEIWAGLLREHGRGGVEWIDQQEARAQVGGRPVAQTAEVGEVAHPPLADRRA